MIAGFVVALRRIDPTRKGIALPIYMNEVLELATDGHLYGHRAEDVDSHGRPIRRDPRTDLHVVWTEGYMQSQSWTPMTLPFAAGLSGAGAWVFEDKENNEVLPHLVGIAWAHSPVGCIRLVPMSAALAFLEAQSPSSASR